MKTMSPAEALEANGWLTLNQFVQYLKDEHPIKSLSYPAILRYVEKGILEAIKVGGQRRITKECIEHYLQYGVEVPYGADPADFGVGEESQMTPSPTLTPSPHSRPATEVTIKSTESALPGTLVIPAIPESRVKRPNIPPPPDDED